MRWWLALLLAAVAGGTAVLSGSLYLDRSEAGLRERASDLAVARVTRAANEINSALRSGRPLREALANAQTAAGLSLVLLTEDGASLIDGPSLETPGTTYASVVAAVRDGDRFVRERPDGTAAIVGLPLRAGGAVALMGTVDRSEIQAALGILREARTTAIVVTIAAGALMGLLTAVFLTRRLRRVAVAARRIEAGDFAEPLAAGFSDEVGKLARAVDGVRERLRASFADLEHERDQVARVLERLPEGVLTVDRELGVQVVNPQARSLLAERPRVVFTRDQIMQHLWRTPFGGADGPATGTSSTCATRSSGTPPTRSFS